MLFLQLPGFLWLKVQVMRKRGSITPCPGTLPKQHLLQHAIGRHNSGKPTSGEGVQLQVGGNELGGHVRVCSCPSTTTTKTYDRNLAEIQSPEGSIRSGASWITFTKFSGIKRCF